MKRRHTLYLLLSFGLLLLSLIISISLGAARIPIKEIIQTFQGAGNETSRIIILSLRIPRVLEVALVGAGLSIAGAFFQGLLANPLADPYVLGVSSGASLGATISIILGLGGIWTGSLAFTLALLSIYTVYRLAVSGAKVSVASMLLAGIALSTFLNALISLLMLFNHKEIAEIVFWTMGSFTHSSWNDLLFAAPVIFVCSLVLYLFSHDLNVMLTGEETAEHLGINTLTLKRVILAGGSLITAVTVSIAGTIGFVGLIVPHICRLMVGPDNRILVPFSALFGAVFLLLTDTLARTVLAPVEIPTGIITAAVGGPFFLYLLLKDKKKQEGM